MLSLDLDIPHDVFSVSGERLRNLVKLAASEDVTRPRLRGVAFQRRVDEDGRGDLVFSASDGHILVQLPWADIAPSQGTLHLGRETPYADEEGKPARIPTQHALRVLSRMTADAAEEIAPCGGAQNADRLRIIAPHWLDIRDPSGKSPQWEYVVMTDSPSREPQDSYRPEDFCQAVRAEPSVNHATVEGPLRSSRLAWRNVCLFDATRPAYGADRRAEFLTNWLRRLKEHKGWSLTMTLPESEKEQTTASVGRGSLGVWLHDNPAPGEKEVFHFLTDDGFSAKNPPVPRADGWPESARAVRRLDPAKLHAACLALLGGDPKRVGIEKRLRAMPSGILRCAAHQQYAPARGIWMHAEGAHNLSSVILTTEPLGEDEPLPKRRAVVMPMSLERSYEHNFIHSTAMSRNR